MAMNPKVVPRSRSDYFPSVLYSYVVKNLNILGEFHQTAIHQFSDFTELLLDTPLKARLDLPQTGRELIMNRLRPLNSCKFTTRSKVGMENNNERLGKSTQRFQEAFFLHECPTRLVGTALESILVRGMMKRNTWKMN